MRSALDGLPLGFDILGSSVGVNDIETVRVKVSGLQPRNYCGRGRMIVSADFQLQTGKLNH
jgi:hypothetical protein